MFPRRNSLHSLAQNIFQFQITTYHQNVTTSTFLKKICQIVSASQEIRGIKVSFLNKSWISRFLMGGKKQLENCTVSWQSDYLYIIFWSARRGWYCLKSRLNASQELDIGQSSNMKNQHFSANTRYRMWFKEGMLTFSSQISHVTGK